GDSVAAHVNGFKLPIHSAQLPVQVPNRELRFRSRLLSSDLVRERLMKHRPIYTLLSIPYRRTEIELY
ncbi:MAG: hypothetical protein KGQ60_11705, partial [Planctomycetes bacterium]|nr:hypothetical protein [Planctomycetota bacterium]